MKWIAEMPLIADSDFTALVSGFPPNTANLTSHICGWFLFNPVPLYQGKEISSSRPPPGHTHDKLVDGVSILHVQSTWPRHNRFASYGKAAFRNLDSKIATVASMYAGTSD